MRHCGQSLSTREDTTGPPVVSGQRTSLATASTCPAVAMNLELYIQVANWLYYPPAWPMQCQKPCPIIHFLQVTASLNPNHYLRNLLTTWKIGHWTLVIQHGCIYGRPLQEGSYHYLFQASESLHPQIPVSLIQPVTHWLGSHRPKCNNNPSLNTVVCLLPRASFTFSKTTS